jgi:hypothetical protein
MSLLNAIARNPIKSVVLGVASFAGITYGALAISLTRSGETVYQGSINQQRISYHEEATHMHMTPATVTRDHENRLELTRGETTFEFIDSLNFHPLNYQKLRGPVGYEEDELERIVVRNKELGVKTFDSRDINNETLYGVHVGNVFARGNQIYRALRDIMREELRAEARTGYAVVEAEFGQIDTRNPRTTKQEKGKKANSVKVPVEKLKKELNSNIDKFEQEVEAMPIVPGKSY